MKNPYVGITGFMSRDEAESVMESAPKNSKRLVMIGVLASQKTVHGIKNKWPNRYPQANEIAGIFPSNTWAFNVIHFNTKEPETLYRRLIELYSLGGAGLHGFQLNIAWPNPSELERIKRACPSIEIILQLGERAFKMIDKSPLRLAKKIGYYRGLIDHILLDPSGGLGKPLDTEMARACLAAISEMELNIGLGVAGGLSPNTLNLARPLVKDFPNLSIDAESRLRNDNDHLDLALAREYVLRSFAMFCKPT